jgi:hypothetical protein
MNDLTSCRGCAHVNVCRHSRSLVEAAESAMVAFYNHLRGEHYATIQISCKYFRDERPRGFMLIGEIPQRPEPYRLEVKI